MSKSHDDEIRAMFPLIKVADGWRRPEYVVAGAYEYRGKVQFVAGYANSRTNSHNRNGATYDRILGWGDTQEAAIKKMREKLTRSEDIES
jgi:hypothetical protein